MEELPLGSNCTHTALHAIAQHNHDIVVEQVRDGIQIVTVIVCIGILYVLIVILQLNEYEGKTVYKAYNISSALMDWTFYPKLPYGNKLVVIDIGKVHYASLDLFCLDIPADSRPPIPVILGHLV